MNPGQGRRLWWRLFGSAGPRLGSKQRGVGVARNQVKQQIPEAGTGWHEILKGEVAYVSGEYETEEYRRLYGDD